MPSGALQMINFQPERETTDFVKFQTLTIHKLMKDEDLKTKILQHSHLKGVKVSSLGCIVPLHLLES